MSGSSRLPSPSATSTRASTPAPTTFRRANASGFHVIEKALWEEGTAAGMTPVAEAAPRRRRRTGSEGQERRPAGGPDRQRGERAAGRGLGVEDHRRGGALLAHRPGRLRGQRRRRRGGLRSGRAAALRQGPEAGQGNRSPLRRRLRLAEAVPQGRRLRLLHGTDEGGHSEAGAGNRRAGRTALAGSGADRQRGIDGALGRRVLSRRWGPCPRKLRARTSISTPPAGERLA